MHILRHANILLQGCGTDCAHGSCMSGRGRLQKKEVFLFGIIDLNRSDTVCMHLLVKETDTPVLGRLFHTATGMYMIL